MSQASQKKLADVLKKMDPEKLEKFITVIVSHNSVLSDPDNAPDDVYALAIASPYFVSGAAGVSMFTPSHGARMVQIVKAAYKMGLDQGKKRKRRRRNMNKDIKGPNNADEISGVQLQQQNAELRKEVERLKDSISWSEAKTEDDNCELRKQVAQLTEELEKCRKERDKFGDIEHQLENYKEQWRRHYESEFKVKFEDEAKDAYEAIHRIGTALGLEEYTATKVSEIACSRLKSTPAPSPWVACSERLPDETKESDGSTTVVLTNRKLAPACGSPFQTSNVTYLRLHPDEYTHWMPIPPLHESDKDEREFREWQERYMPNSVVKTKDAREAWQAARGSKS